MLPIYRKENQTYIGVNFKTEILYENHIGKEVLVY